MNELESSSSYLSRTSKEYAIYTCEHRAIPRVTDGLKSGQRIALWVIRNKSEQMKTMALTGLSSYENLFIHGDASMNETISSLAAPYLNNLCYLDGIGTFGSKLAPDAFGAPRYTSVKKSKFANDVLYTDLDLVPLVENYDSSNYSASTFLPIIPTVLLNGISGIATGWSTDILPHSLNDIIDACISELSGNEIGNLMPYFKMYNQDIVHLEKSSWMLKGKLTIDDSSTVSIIELPFGMKIEGFIKFLDDLEDKDKIKSYTDKSTKHVNIRVKLSREFMRDQTVDSLLSFFKLHVRTTERMVVIGFDNKMKVYDSHSSLIKDFVAWRLTWYNKRYEKLLGDTEALLRFELSLQACFDNGLPDRLSGLPNKQAVVEDVKSIVAEFDIDDRQIERIVSMPSYRWTTDNYGMVVEEINRLTSLIENYLDILADPQKIKDIYKDELLSLRKKYDGE